MLYCEQRLLMLLPLQGEDNNDTEKRRELLSSGLSFWDIFLGGSQACGARIEG